MLKGSARLFIGTRFVADTASNAKRANPAWTPSEGVSTAARLQLRCLSWVIFDQFSRFCLPDNVRFAQKTTKLLRGSEMTRSANRRHVSFYD